MHRAGCCKYIGHLSDTLSCGWARRNDRGAFRPCDLSRGLGLAEHTICERVERLEHELLVLDHFNVARLVSRAGNHNSPSRLRSDVEHLLKKLWELLSEALLKLRLQSAA